MTLVKAIIRPAKALLIGFFGVVLSASSGFSEVFMVELEKALAQSHQINAARQGYLSAREDVLIAQKSLEWSATLTGGHQYSETSVNGGDFAETNNTNVAVTLKRSLFDGGLASAQENVAQLQLNITEAQVKTEEEAVLLSAIEAFTGVVTARQQMRISRSNVARLKEHLRAGQVKLSVGDSTETELAGTKARLARAEANLIESETALANAEANYQSIIGAVPAGLSMPPMATNLPETSLTAAEQALNEKANHYIARMAERIARMNMEVLVAQVKPNLDLSLVGKSVDNTLVTRDTEEMSASLNFSMPLYPSSSVRAKSRGVVADHRQALFQYQDSGRLTRLAAENAFRDYTASQLVIKAYEAELIAAEAVRDGTSREVEFGEKTILDLLDAEQDVVSAQLNLLVARRNLINSSYGLKAATGTLTTVELNLAGLGDVADEAEIVSPLKGPYPRIEYPE